MHKLDSLAALNGYKKVYKIKLQAALAEGVVAIQNGEMLKHYSIYSRPSFSKKHAQESAGCKAIYLMTKATSQEGFFIPLCVKTMSLCTEF
jgi:hypothetical protein